MFLYPTINIIFNANILVNFWKMCGLFFFFVGVAGGTKRL